MNGLVLDAFCHYEFFTDISKKGNKFHDHKVKKMMKKNISKFLNKFSKELVITVGDKSISISTPFVLNPFE